MLDALHMAMASMRTVWVGRYSFVCATTQKIKTLMDLGIASGVGVRSLVLTYTAVA